MNRTVKFFATFSLLIILFLGSSFFLESCKGKGESETVYEESDDSEYSSDEEIYDEYFESAEEASRAGVEVDDLSNTEMDPEYQTAEQDAVEFVEEDFSFEASDSEKEAINSSVSDSNDDGDYRTSASKKSNSQSSFSQSSSSGGNFFVVAGSYLIQDNADKMVDKLRGMGFSEAEVVKFDDSKYHTITAGRYNSYDSAGEVASSLKQKGIDCYVHTRK